VQNSLETRCRSVININGIVLSDVVRCLPGVAIDAPGFYWHYCVEAGVSFLVGGFLGSTEHFWTVGRGRDKCP
jgi:hypothetical protein